MTSHRSLLPLLLLAPLLAFQPACDKKKDGASEKDEKKPKKCKDFDACKSACDDDKAGACVQLGNLHRQEPHGDDGKWDPVAVKKAYSKACKSGDQEGCALQASMEVYKTKKAYDLAKGACEADVPLGCAIEGDILLSGRDYEDGKVEKDEAAGKKSLKKQCDKDNLLACVALGNHYQWGGGDKEKAAELFKKACDGGETVGCFNYGAFSTSDKEKSIEWLAKGCDEGLAGWITNRDNSCRVEAERQLEWVKNTSVRAFVKAGQPTPGSDEAAAFKKKLADDPVFQKRDKRLKEIGPWACNMGATDACKLIDENPTWFKKK